MLVEDALADMEIEVSVIIEDDGSAVPVEARALVDGEVMSPYTPIASPGMPPRIPDRLGGRGFPTLCCRALTGNMRQ